MSGCVFIGFSERDFKGFNTTESYRGSDVDDVYALSMYKSFQIKGPECVAKMTNESGDNMGHVIAGNYNMKPFVVPPFKFSLMNKRSKEYSFITEDGLFDNEPTVERMPDEYSIESGITSANDSSSNVSKTDTSSTTKYSKSEINTTIDTGNAKISGSSSINNNGEYTSFKFERSGSDGYTRNKSGYSWNYILLMMFLATLVPIIYLSFTAYFKKARLPKKGISKGITMTKRLMKQY